MKRFLLAEKLLISHQGRELNAECRRIIEETPERARQLELHVEGILLTGHLVRLTTDRKEFVPCLVRESATGGTSCTIIVQAMQDWRATSKTPKLE